MAKDIKSQIFMDLIHKAIKVGYVDIGGVKQRLQVGSPQGSIISPTLCNIYLHELDTYIENLTKSFDKGNRRASNPEYTKLMRPKTPEERKEARRLIREQGIRALKAEDPNFKRLRYIRYADDFILGVIGSKEDATHITEQIASFLEEKLKLNLSKEKTKITHAITEKARFLGVDIRNTPFESNPLKKVNYKGKGIQLVRGSTRPQLLAPIRKIVDKLASKGYLTAGKPTRVGRLIHLTPAMIVNHYVTVARGIINYFSFVNNYARMRARVLYILKYSCALTLCAKLRLRTLHKTFAKFGYNLAIKNDQGRIIKEFNENSFPHSAPGFKTSNYDPLSIIELSAKVIPRTIKMFEQSSCKICDSSEKIEMHHVKHLKKNDSKPPKDYLTKLMVRMNRKQIPLCRECPLAIHKGTYNGVKLNKLG